MRNKSFKKTGAAIMAAVLMMSSFGNMSAVEAKTAATQMSSDKEVVYVNNYGASEREQNFDSSWKFYLGQADGAENVVFDDSRWETVNLPHDYSIEQEYTSSGEAESAYLLGGTGWYRKYFTLSDEVKGKEVRIDFGGVYMDSTVWVNGTKVGSHPYGYTSFSFDITDYVKFGEENVITVKVNHQTPSSRWYSGSGIYRSVNLTVTDPVHVDLYGTEISTPDLETEQNGTVNMNVLTTVANAGSTAKEVTLVHTIVVKDTDDSIGTVTTKAQKIEAGKTAEIETVLQAENPELWSVDEPNLYTVITEVKVGNEVVDTYETTYGFRYFDFDSSTGFSLNGEPMKLKGVCMHHDQGSLGAEAHEAAIRRQVKILKEMGCNSIRVTHNPAASELIKACDELGMMVIEEAFDGWVAPKNGNSYDYSRFFKKTIGSDNAILGGTADMTWSEFDLTAMIKRDYNAASIIMWSLGNEVWEGTSGATQEYATQAERLAKMASELDSTRPATIGDNNLKNGNSISYSMAGSLHKYNGVVGANYCNGSQYDTVHNAHPEWAFYGAETASSVNSRGVYDTIANNSLNAEKELTSYDYSAVGWGAKASDAWYTVITRDYLAGEYVWTGFDYLGEPTPANGIYSGWVSGTNSPKNSFFGIVDTAGLPKDSYYFYQSQWNEDVNTLHVLPAWNEDVVYNKANVPVVVYSDAASVKLELETADGTVKDLGTKKFTQKTTKAGFTYQIYEGTGASSTQHQNLYLTWYVPFEEGTLRATAYDAAGNEIKDTVGRSYVTTTGEEAKLEAFVDRKEITADGKDLAYITVNVTDSEGNIVPDASNQVTFNVEGEGVLVGVDNGKQSDHQSFQDDNRAAYNGSLVAIVQSTKEASSFTVTASASGLKGASVTVKTVAADNGSDADDETVTGFYMAKNYYVKVGNKPVLPETVEVRYANGTTAEKKVVWGAINDADYAKAGSFGVNGVVEGIYTISVTINMIDELGGLLNYSTTTALGKAPTLPEGRPAVSVDGTILNVTFPVEWAEIKAADYAKAGTFTVKGTADVLGEEMTVTATVRVQDETITIGESISKEALSLTQDIEESLQSDNLDAIKDGITNPSSVSSGTNKSIWTNYNNSEAGDNKAEIVFEYATQQRFGEFVVHHYKDGWSAEYPDANTTEIYTSNDGSKWTKLDVKETIGEEVASGDVATKPYTYSFDPATVTFVKFCFTNSSASAAAGFTCTGITEIELKIAEGTFVTYGTAELASLTVDGHKLTAAELAEGVYYTVNTAPTVKATGADNASVTVLPAQDGKILLIIEAEDHTVRSTFTIIVGQEKPADPSDASNDIAVDQMTAISGSQYLPGTANEGPDDYVLDGNANTHWHTNWATTEGKDVEKRWIGVELEEAAQVAGIRYLPRQHGGSNGAVTTYKVQYRTDNNGEWITVAEGNWDRNDSDWKLVTFEAVTAKQVRVVGVNTYADSGNNAHMSASELRLIGANGDISAADKEELQMLIEDAESVDLNEYAYVAQEIIEEFKDALAEAKAVEANVKADQETVNAAADRLAAAIDALLEAPKGTDVVRLSGKSRYETGIQVAEELRDVLGVDKFESAVIATGKNFADALSGSYLASVKNAPILLTNGNPSDVAELHAYIRESVEPGATIYILGGEGAVPKNVEDIQGFVVKRLEGKSRYETNLAILKEAGLKGDDLLVATGKSFADSLSASAAARPILLVKPDTALNDAQKAVAANFKNIYVIGGESAVSASAANEFEAYGTVKRLSGTGRYETSVAVANEFFADPEVVVLANGKNFPDGLCGGPLAAALDAPLVLTKDGGEAVAAAYVADNGIASGYVLGGTGAIADETVVNIFALDSAEDIK